MENNSGGYYEGEEPTESQKERIRHANEVYRKVCAETGVEISSWYSFEAWKEFVDGKIGEPELEGKAKQEMEQFYRSFGKYVVIDKQEEARHLKEEEEEKERARKANKIYRKVCEDVGLEVSFFHDFKSWSEFVEGRITEAEFYERAKSEALRIAAGRGSVDG